MTTDSRSGGSAAHARDFRPFVADSARVAEFTPKAIVLGSLFAILFGAATVYLVAKQPPLRRYR